ncbi:MAG: hypothetical protein F4147_06015, partial [Gammaproteobacteria bacterium]|nr:hypothetical protein [Gammaproteobacteria bacterium]
MYAEPDAWLRDDYNEAAENRSNFIIRNRPYIGQPGLEELPGFIERIDEVVFDACGMPEPDRDRIREFCANIV